LKGFSSWRRKRLWLMETKEIDYAIDEKKAPLQRENLGI
jgi:hypothetical protein